MMSPEARAEMKALIREAVAEELDERMLRRNQLAIQEEMRRSEAFLQTLGDRR